MQNIPIIPPGYASVAPWIIGKDTVRLMSFLSEAFDAEDLGSFQNPDGSIGHAEMRIGNTIILMFDMRDWPPTPAFLRLFVEDAEELFKRAVAAGAQPITQVTHLAFGDKVGRVRDPYGNVWWLQQRVENVSDEEIGQRWSDPKWSTAMDYLQTSLRKLYQ
ncbi:VOC family protein [Tistrella sp. BH-R2-4]|uniref:VOC family protein n=2 Tax=Alphaproteobacteria TaxID=28211 RepID=A0ABU9YQ86_9PROT|nr:MULTISPECIES: VOC family protein [Phyllobacteriaceae]MDN2565879.1 VOC family protein [Aquibium sp. A9E412]NRC54309.1 VOC family protein [Mesorhizobium sediminum]NRC57403.1 VOC family protein [Mesorhizobium sediminum]